MWDAYSPRITEAAQTHRTNVLRERHDAARAARAAEEALKTEAAAVCSSRGEQIRARRVEIERRSALVQRQAQWLLHVALGARCGRWAHALTVQRPLREMHKTARIIQVLLLTLARTRTRTPTRTRTRTPTSTLSPTNLNPHPNPNPNVVQAQYVRHHSRVVTARKAKAECLLAGIVPLLRLRTRVRLRANAAGIIAEQLLSVAKLGVACIAVRAFCYRVLLLLSYCYCTANVNPNLTLTRK